MSAFEEVATVDVNAGAGAKSPLMDNQKVPGSGLGPLPSCASNSIATECDDRDDVAVEDVETNEDSVARIEGDAGDIAAVTPDTNDNAKETREHRQGCVSQFFSTIGLGCRQMTSDAVSPGSGQAPIVAVVHKASVDQRLVSLLDYECLLCTAQTALTHVLHRA